MNSVELRLKNSSTTQFRIRHSTVPEILQKKFWSYIYITSWTKYIIYTSMINAIQEETQMSQLLPLKKADFTMQIPIDIPREELALKPSPEAVMDRIVPNYVVGFVYGALVESFSCEQNARMMAMQSASNSARDMLAELDILYNRARQAAITQEITEVIAGAKSQKKKRK